MKKISFHLLFIIISVMSFAQDSWKVHHNKIEVLNTSTSDPVQNVITLKQADLIAHGDFVVNYNEDKLQKNWIRYMGVYDGAENMVVQIKGATILKLPNKTLKDLLAMNSILKIFTWTLPTDPELAARIRVRRLHLCTIELK